MNHKILEANSIPIPPQLAGSLKQVLGRSGTGFDEGAFLQQLHYWTLNSATTGWMVAGVKWIYNSLKAWQQQFPWMSEYGLRKAIANLKKLGLIQTAQHWINQYKRVMFYRIDYEKLKLFAPDLCDMFTHRDVNNDQLDVRSHHTSYPETSSDTSFSEQQTQVVLEVVLKEEVIEERDTVALLEQDAGLTGEVDDSGEGDFTPPSSGKSSNHQLKEFPELIDAMAQVIGQAPPAFLQRAISQFPDRVKPAISYLQCQQHRRSISNPLGYLYRAIMDGWDLAVPLAITPPGFTEWFDQAKAQGLVMAAMAIEGVHYTLHSQQGWVPTTELMQGCLR